MPKISLVIPCFNEEKNVSRMFEETERAFADSGYELEYVFVNDGSRDGTLSALKRLHAEENANFRIVSFSRNFGKEAAIYAGLKNATGDYTVIIDADLQQRPEVVLEMAHILDSRPDTDCVAAFQQKRRESALLIFFKKSFYSIINKLTDTKFVQGASDFRLFRTSVREAVLEMSEYHRFSKGIFSWVGFETEYIPYEVMERESGSSKWSFVKLMKYAIEGIVAFTTKPLHIASLLGTLCTLGGTVYYLIALILAILEGGWSAPGLIVASIFLVGGLIMLCIGILGEYLSKVYVQVKERPVYITKTVLTKDKQ